MFPFVPAGADAEPGPAAGQHVERRHRLDQDPRMAIGHAGDQCAERDPLADAGREGQRRYPSSIGSSASPIIGIWKK